MGAGKLYLAAMWRNRRPLIGWLAGALLCGTAYLMLAEPVYEAEVRVLIQKRGRDSDGSTAKTYDKEFLSTQAEVIHSPLTISAACAALADSMELEPSDMSDAVEEVAKELRVNTLANTDIVRVAYRDSDAGRATAMLREILASYQARLREDERATSEQSVELLRDREAALRDDLARLEAEYAALRALTPLVGDPRDSVDLAATRVRDVTSQLTDIRNRRRQLEQSLSYVDTLAEPLQPDQVLPVMMAIDTTATRPLDDAQQELAQARARLEAARTVYDGRHPHRQAAEQLVLALEERLAEQTLSVLQSLRRRLPLMAAEESQLAELLATETQAMKLLDESLVRERHLAAEIEHTRERHHAAMALLHDVQLSDQAVAQGAGGVYVRVLDEYVAPDKPLWPQPAPLLAACAILSLLIGLIVVAVQERLPIPGVLSGPGENHSSGRAVAEQACDARRDEEVWTAMQRLQETISAAGSVRTGAGGSMQPPEAITT